MHTISGLRMQIEVHLDQRRILKDFINRVLLFVIFVDIQFMYSEVYTSSLLSPCNFFFPHCEYSCIQIPLSGSTWTELQKPPQALISSPKGDCTRTSNNKCALLALSLVGMEAFSIYSFVSGLFISTCLWNSSIFL